MSNVAVRGEVYLCRYRRRRDDDQPASCTCVRDVRAVYGAVGLHARLDAAIAVPRSTGLAARRHGSHRTTGVRFTNYRF